MMVGSDCDLRRPGLQWNVVGRDEVKKRGVASEFAAICSSRAADTDKIAGLVLVERKTPRALTAEIIAGAWSLPCL